jgi:hypothetical protein
MSSAITKLLESVDQLQIWQAQQNDRCRLESDGPSDHILWLRMRRHPQQDSESEQTASGKGARQ